MEQQQQVQQPNLNFLHLRDYTFGGIAARGGATVAWKIDTENQVLQYTYSVCSEKDVFCKKTGRDLSTARFSEENKVNIIPMYDIHEYLARVLIPDLIMDKSVVTNIRIEQLSRKLIHRLIRMLCDN